MPKTLRAKALERLQLLRRLEHSDDNGYCACVSCGKQDHYKNMDGGHFIPKGDSSYWALEHENVHPQCKGCNGFGMRYGTASQQYTIFMQDMYGEDFVKHMLKTKKKTKKIYTPDYREMIKDLDDQIRRQKKRLGV